MRKEFLGPLPAGIGLLLLVAVAVAPAGPPPPDCACQVLSPVSFERLEASGYPGVADGDLLVIDGRVDRVAPPSLVEAPYHLLRFEGSAIEFNVTQFDGAVPFEGAWARLQTVHQGQREAGGPQTGHRWRYVGPTAAPGDTAVPLAGLSVGLALLVWGAATYGMHRRARDLGATLRARADRAEQAARAEPALSGDRGALLQVAQARRQVRRGQHASAEETLSQFEAVLARARGLGEMIDAMDGSLAQVEALAGATGGSAARAARDKALERRAAGALGEAEEWVARAMEELRTASRALSLVDRARALLGGPAEDPAVAEAAKAAAGRAEALLRRGAWEEAQGAADEAMHLATAASHEAQEALRAIEDLEDAVSGNRTADAAREVAGQLAQARSAYGTGDFGHARALADAARWVVDPAALDDEGLRALLARRWGARGWRAEVGGGRPPAGGVVFARGDERVLLLTGGWREFPTERVLLAAKDFLRAGHATRARVYSSAFANTSTDPSVAVVTARELLKELVEAAESPLGRQ